MRLLKRHCDKNCRQAIIMCLDSLQGCLWLCIMSIYKLVKHTAFQCLALKIRRHEKLNNSLRFLHRDTHNQSPNSSEKKLNTTDVLTTPKIQTTSHPTLSLMTMGAQRPQKPWEKLQAIWHYLKGCIIRYFKKNSLAHQKGGHYSSYVRI